MALSPRRPHAMRHLLVLALGWTSILGGFAVLAAHGTGIALTEHLWNVVAQGMLLAGAAIVLTAAWGRPKKSRR
ncbi:MAG: hypothetical protein ACRDF5_01475 [bacterium]